MSEPVEKPEAVALHRVVPGATPVYVWSASWEPFIVMAEPKA